MLESPVTKVPTDVKTALPIFKNLKFSKNGLSHISHSHFLPKSKKLSIMQSFKCFILYHIFSSLIPHIHAMHIHLTWSTQKHCEKVIDPKWPFAYSKTQNQTEEYNGRVSSNRQDVGHACQTRGVRSKCHICSDFSCVDPLLDPVLNTDKPTEGRYDPRLGPFTQCHFQLQGVSWSSLTKNIPTISDVPWAVGGNHRYDFGAESTTHVCMYLNGDYPCQSSFGRDYSSCRTRCWGYKKGWSGLNNAIVSNSKKGWLLLNSTPWTIPEPSVAWAYPNQEDDGTFNRYPSYLPQGYAYTRAGSTRGEYGFRDGYGHDARFYHPEGVAVDNNGYVYVADTGNHAIRMISPKGKVITIAGTGKAGSRDGPGMYVAEFSSPGDIVVWRNWQLWPLADTDDPDTIQCHRGNGNLVLFVADTGNHRIRKITGDIYTSDDGELEWRNVVVSCHSGYCLDNQIQRASPQPGYSDGPKHLARFDSPRGLTVSNDGIIFVADSNNHLIRMVDKNGFTSTISGKVTMPGYVSRLDAEKYPCSTGEDVQIPDSVLEYEFSFPVDVALGFNKSYLFVVDQHKLVLIDLSKGTVNTVAGSVAESIKDGLGAEATFSRPESVVVTSDGRVYVSDSSACRIRRISTQLTTAKDLTCEDTLYAVFRPQGCSSYNAPLDENNLSISPVSSTTFYNYDYRNVIHRVFGSYYIGRTVKNCIGSPSSVNYTKNQVNVDGTKSTNYSFLRDDPNEGSLIKVYCPSHCNYREMSITLDGLRSSTFVLFHESNPICAAAVYLNISIGESGFIDLYVSHVDMSTADTAFSYSFATDEETVLPTIRKPSGRYFSLKQGESEWSVETISGGSYASFSHKKQPVGCGYLDASPAQNALFNSPHGLGAFAENPLDDHNIHLLVADRNNHAIRSISAVCSFPCENDGRCICPNLCLCMQGWSGEDCSIPLCSSPCPERQLCTAPNSCSCIPGYQGKHCDHAICVQICQHGFCSFPDTCTCQHGWFDFQCGSPVCEQTCGNHGTCIAPNTCQCIDGWTGIDCRTPFCEQKCQNGSYCVAPNTCQCTPDWTGHACQSPICRQGTFKPFDEDANYPLLTWNQFTPCQYQKWCESTHSFDCLQQKKVTKLVDAQLSMERFNKMSEDLNSDCILLELRPDAISMFSPIKSWDNTAAPDMRYSSPLPFGHLSENFQEWNVIDDQLSAYDHTYVYSDRQIVRVEYRNIVEGKYVCANGGTCVAPDVCSCPHGYIGFDCRTPVCEQGFYDSKQLKLTTTLETEEDLSLFHAFLSEKLAYNIDRTNQRYSNPPFSRIVESFINYTSVDRKLTEFGNVPYLAFDGIQGGYSCSIRSVTQWENSTFMFEHPSYYSRYMNTKLEDDNKRYTFWESMGWSPTYKKSKALQVYLSELYPDLNGGHDRLFVYTDEGYRKGGVWSRTNSSWEKGLCVVEFYRTCNADGAAGSALEMMVQDTDISFRPRCHYDDEKEYCTSPWDYRIGECIDIVRRGCFNNGTCVAPNTCVCAPGFMGDDCSEPTCTPMCKHGNCTLPNTCTCEKGWHGEDCSVPLCAQECNNNGFCSAPDTCTCMMWENQWLDGRDVHLFRTSDGLPQMTGWTGYDCSTPICVQAERFVLNINLKSYRLEEVVLLGGHGRDGTISCDNVSCPVYNQMVTMNDGRSFQTGCGFDPLYTGCCVAVTNNDGIIFTCYKCNNISADELNHSVTCISGALNVTVYSDATHIPMQFKSRYSQQINICGPQHNPGYYVSTDPVALPELSNRNYLSKVTSDPFLCKRFEWKQGEYLNGRQVRVNHHLFSRNTSNLDSWIEGHALPGEGIYECHNGGSCIGPDICSCADGYTGFDCRTALCRHEQADGSVVGCLNNGFCAARDTCVCPQVRSVLWTNHPSATHGLTGFTGSDCSIAICVQGYYDPTCKGDLALGGEGCYRCANGGYCTKPDECTCSKGWTGYSCEEPVCEVVATEEVRQQLMTQDENKVVMYEKDPCGMKGFYEPDFISGIPYSRGNCTRPNQCTCLCKARYDAKLCRAVGGVYCKRPFQDRFYKFRNVLAPNEMFGTRSCSSGYEGQVDENDRFISCHMKIYEPTILVRRSGVITVFGVIALILCCFTFFYVKKRMRFRSRRLRRSYSKKKIN